MRSTTTYRAGQVVVVSVPYTTQTGFKSRPAVVVSQEPLHRRLLDILVCPISSQPKYTHHPGPGDLPLAFWKKVGLRHASAVRVSNLHAVDKALIQRPLGQLHPDDYARLQEGLREAFGL